MNETHDIASAQKLRAISKPADSRQIEVPELGTLGHPAPRATQDEPLPAPPRAGFTSAPGSSHSNQLERWRLTGPAIRELPSPSYLRGMEDLQEGFVETMIQEVAKDFQLSRERAMVNDAANRRSVDIQSYIALIYAAAALVAGFLLVARGHETPGTFVLAMSGIALVIGTQPWSGFANRNQAPKPPRRQDPEPHSNTDAEPAKSSGVKVRPKRPEPTATP